MSNETIRSKKDFWFSCIDIDVVRDNNLSVTAKYVFTVLCTFVTVNNRGCWPSNDAVAEAAGVSVPTVKRAYKELEERGVIARSTRYNQGEGQTSSYTKIVGHNAECYNEAGSSPVNHPQLTDELPPSSPVNPKGNQENNIYYSNEGEKAPEPACEPETREEIIRPDNPDETYEPEQAPEIMQPTARYLLQRTGRKNLAWNEISALRELAASQYPTRVNKEIDKAVERFTRQGRDLKTLRFEYIASALAHQPTYKKKSKSKVEAPKPQEVATCANDNADEEMARIEALQAKFDEEAKR